MSQVFPYGITLQEGGAIAVFPAAEVSFPTADGEYLSLFLIIDSGATISALPKGDAAVLGINSEDGAPITVSGMSGSLVRGWRHEITVRLGTKFLQLPFIFLDDEHAPRILGRAGVFEQFTIVFEENKRRTGLLDHKDAEAKTIEQTLDSIAI